MTKRLLECAAALALIFAVFRATDGPVWDATLSSAWGTGSARAGIEALGFVQGTMPPVMLLSLERRYAGDRLAGPMFVSAWEAAPTGNEITATFAYDKTAPASVVLTSTVYCEFPVGAAAIISGTIRYASLAPDGGGCCLYGIVECP
jgi:hypothetical protein